MGKGPIFRSGLVTLIANAIKHLGKGTYIIKANQIFKNLTVHYSYNKQYDNTELAKILPIAMKSKVLPNNL